MSTERMENAKREYALNRWDACFLAALLPIVYLSVYLLLPHLRIGLRSSHKVSFAAIIGFAVLWLALLKSLRSCDTDPSRRLLVTLEAIALTLVCPAMACFGALLFIIPVAGILNRVPLYLFCTVIVGLDIVWVMLMLRWRSKSPHARVLLSCIVFTFSASLAIVCPIFVDILSSTPP